MPNLQADANAFQEPFRSALQHSKIRETDRAKSAEHLAALFAKQTEQLLHSFKQAKKSGGYVSEVQGTGQQLGTVVNNYFSDSPLAARWNKMEAELRQILSAYGINPVSSRPEQKPGRATPDRSANAASCSATVGSHRANQLVQECLEVSPATHPPCNVQNSCSFIIDEIKRSCALLGNQAPSFCGEYR